MSNQVPILPNPNPNPNSLFPGLQNDLKEVQEKGETKKLKHDQLESMNMKAHKPQFSHLLMWSSASFNGILGIIFSFFPQEVLSQFGEAIGPLTTLALQILGAFYMGLALMNYTGKKAVVGGIYNRPIQMGNTVYCSIAAITLIKYMAGQSFIIAPAIMVVSLTYVLLAGSFLKLLFTSPVKESNA